MKGSLLVITGGFEDNLSYDCICLNCDKQVDDDKFCNNCGNNLRPKYKSLKKLLEDFGSKI